MTQSDSSAHLQKCERLYTVDEIGNPARFWSKVEKQGPAECWEWTAHRKDGRAIYSIKHRACPAARIAFVLNGGTLKSGMLVCHHCDNAGCVNPAHLYQGTYLDNARDLAERGHRVIPAGSAHPNSKLTDDQVRQIRARYDAGEKRNHLAKEFGVSFPVLDVVARRLRYRNVA